MVYKYNGNPVTRMNLEDIMLSEITQSKRQTLYDSTYMCYLQEADSHKQKSSYQGLEGQENCQTSTVSGRQDELFKPDKRTNPPPLAQSLKIRKKYFISVLSQILYFKYVL